MTKVISYKLKFLDSPRFIAPSLSNLVDNLVEEIHTLKCKYAHDNKNAKHVGLNANIVSAVLDTQMLKMI